MMMSSHSCLLLLCPPRLPLLHTIGCLLVDRDIAQGPICQTASAQLVASRMLAIAARDYTAPHHSMPSAANPVRSMYSTCNDTQPAGENSLAAAANCARTTPAQIGVLRSHKHFSLHSPPNAQ